MGFLIIYIYIYIYIFFFFWGGGGGVGGPYYRNDLIDTLVTIPVRVVSHTQVFYVVVRIRSSIGSVLARRLLGAWQYG